ncbi:phosphoglycerate kinase [Streptomyces sp. NPDC102279]|uniref:phosphoglycerate kinase n=1 Tax=Streptomyces sp. NPDC102279 TaxID=3366153 RepID=UPI003826D0DF
MISHEAHPRRPWSDGLPSTSGLWTLGDLGEDTLDGRRVLITADIDVARRQTSNESHFKIARLAETVEYLLQRNAVVLVLGAQGGTSVRVLEPGNTQGLEWHRKALARALPDGRAVTRFDRLDDLSAVAPAPGTVALLPNLAELSREEDVPPSGENALGEALLPTLLRGHFDVFVLDDFRSTVRALPSNVGLAAHKPRAVGLGLQGDLDSLARLVTRSRALRDDSRRSRVCFIGSSRPEDVTVARSLLTADVFDRIVLGPMPSLTIYQELGYALGAGPTADLESLVRTHRAVVAPRAVPSFAPDHHDRLVLPTDFMVANRAGRGKARRVTPEGLGELAEDDRIMSIGPETLKAFAEETRQAGLIFHFGMMSAGQRPYVAYTEAVIRTNLKSTAEVYMAGDHILEIAHDIGLVSALRGRSTGAQTASSLLSGLQVPGLAPFRKADADGGPGDHDRTGDPDVTTPTSGR